MKEELWTVELNLDSDNYSDVCAWHIDTLKGTLQTNRELAVTRRKVQNWAIVAVLKSHCEAQKYAQNFSQILGENEG